MEQPVGNPDSESVVAAVCTVSLRADLCARFRTDAFNSNATRFSPDALVELVSVVVGCCFPHRADLLADLPCPRRFVSVTVGQLSFLATAESSSSAPIKNRHITPI